MRPPLPVIRVSVQEVRFAVRMGKRCPYCVRSRRTGATICLVCARKPDARH